RRELRPVGPAVYAGCDLVAGPRRHGGGATEDWGVELPDSPDGGATAAESGWGGSAAVSDELRDAGIPDGDPAAGGISAGGAGRGDGGGDRPEEPGMVRLSAGWGGNPLRR